MTEPAAEVAGAEALVTRLRDRLGGDAADEVQITTAYGDTTAQVPPDRWVDALTVVRDELGFDFFDWLSAVDELDAGFTVVACVWRLGTPAVPLLLRTRVGRADPRLATATGIFAGAAWPERETYEMFGIVFDGHPNLVPLLLPDGFEGNPLRKEFVLAARVAKPWPGAKEPGESDADVAGQGHAATAGGQAAAARGERAGAGRGAGQGRERGRERGAERGAGRAVEGRRTRRRNVPPGVPDPETWGPRQPPPPPTPSASDDGPEG